jgi:CBS domain-containing protein
VRWTSAGPLNVRAGNYSAATVASACGKAADAIGAWPDAASERAPDHVLVRVERVMTADVVTVSPETSLKDVAEVLTRLGISGLPVCDESGRVLGVVSEADVLQKELGLAPHSGGLFAWLFEQPGESVAKIGARTAGEAMTSPAVTIEAEATVAQAAKLMIERQVNRLPVLRDGELAGIVTRADLVRAFQRTDEEIEREIVEDVLIRTLWVAPDRLKLSVEQGEVTLAGEAENRSEAELIAGYVRRVPGVVAVRSELTWTVDDLARRTSAAADDLPRRL